MSIANKWFLLIGLCVTWTILMLREDGAHLNKTKRKMLGQEMLKCEANEKEEHECLVRMEFVARAQQRAMEPDRYAAANLIDFEKTLLLDNGHEPLMEWKSEPFLTLPDINIVGIPKAGTSHLYEILSTHPNARPFKESRKEYCIYGMACSESAHTSRAKEILFNWNEEQWQRQSADGDQRKTVNGCLCFEHTGFLWTYIRPPPSGNKKTIYLFRDPADLIWASWNFWVDEHWDAIPSTKSNWAQPGHHYRSPELFHEIIKAGDLSYSYRKYVGSHKYHMVCTVKNLLQIYGRENVLFLRNEDMLPTEIEKSGLLDKLSGFTGLDRDKFNSTMVHERTNCNDDKGATVECSNPTKTLAYEISGNRTMFPETRQLIYLDFLEECKIMKREFGVEYPECLGVLDKR